MDSPGYDPVSATGQVAGGANVLCFTTGRGSVFGCKPTPSLKLATNSSLYRRMTDDMDINCGTIVDGEETIQDNGKQIFELIVKHSFRPEDEIRGAGHRRRRVRALEDRRNDVIDAAGVQPT